MTDGLKLKEEFWARTSSADNLSELFEHMPEIYFWVKNEYGQFVMLNQADAEKAGGTCEADILGKTDFEVFPKELALNFDKDDKHVLSTGEKIINKVELVPNGDGTVDWYSTNKIPVYSKDGAVIGVAGTTRNLKKANSLFQPYMEMNHIIEYITKNFASPIEITVLAEMASLSISQFERKFKKMFQISPLKFIIKIRIKSACKALTHTRDTISNIALSCGFYDQSDFSRQFKNHMGMAPREYRKKYFADPS